MFARNYTFDLCCQTARHAENRFRMRIQSAPLPRMELCARGAHSSDQLQTQQIRLFLGFVEKKFVLRPGGVVA